MKLLYSFLLMLMTAAAIAGETPYDEKADAKLEIKTALGAAAKTPIVVVFGANWCGDCIALTRAMKEGASAAMFKRDFRIVKVDVGHFDKNEDIATGYGVPLKKGIPAIAIISPENKVIYVTKEGELASAQKMGDDGIYRFFKRVTAMPKTKE